MWSSPDVVGLFSNNVVSFSRNVVLRDILFSVNLVSKPRMLSVRTVYVLGSLQLGPGRRLRRQRYHAVGPSVVHPSANSSRSGRLESYSVFRGFSFWLELSWLRAA